MIGGCISPKIIEKQDKKYDIIDWDGGELAFVTFKWNLFNTNKSTQILQYFIDLSNERNLSETVVGRFPSGTVWQLGILINQPLDIKNVLGYQIESLTIPAGKYGRMKSEGYPEMLFVHWEKLKKWLLKDKYDIKSPVFEIFTEILAKEIPKNQRKGEIRYRIE